MRDKALSLKKLSFERYVDGEVDEERENRLQGFQIRFIEDS
jgi:hypothetical protein